MAFNLNIQTYLAPIAGANPSGENLRYTAVYDQIKEAKRSDDLLDKGEWLTDLKSSDWRLTITLCSEALIHQSKDLQIAAWLTEALLHQHGFAGLTFGLQLLSSLVTGYWDTLYPEIENDDLDFRVGPFTYLNEKLPVAVHQVPICDPAHTKGFAYYSWEESRMVGADSGLDKEQKGRRQEMIEEGKISAEEFKAAVNMSSIGFYKALCDQLAGCREQLTALDEVVTQRFAADPPGFTQLFDSVSACLRVVEKIYAEKQKSEVAAMDDDDLSPSLEGEVPSGSFALDDVDSQAPGNSIYSQHHAISDISDDERGIWKKVAGKAGNGQLKNALDQLMAAAALAPSVRQKNRYLLLVAKLCLKAGRHDLAKPIVEQLYALIETLKLEQWEHPAWIADVIETLYRCLEQDSEGSSERATQLFQKLCTLNITKAATYRMSGIS
jgi:type VI secretion system protein ImpA